MKEKLTEVQKFRKDAVHNLNKLLDEKTHELILNTKEVVEYLFSVVHHLKAELPCSSVPSRA